ncbi:MAG: hypothetical protein ACI9C1_002186 [Candidatus Aldehydirespiratoraceae bacterium]
MQGSGIVTRKPLLLLDIDGVLNPTVTNPPPGYTSNLLNGHQFHVSDMHLERLRKLAPSADFAWASTWEDVANASVGVALELPHLSFIRFGDDRTADTWKLPYVDQFVSNRALIWAEDNLYLDAFTWAEQRASPTLLVKPSSSVGLTEAHFDQIDDFVGQLGRN